MRTVRYTRAGPAGPRRTSRIIVSYEYGTVGSWWLQHPCKDDEPPGRNLCEDLGLLVGWDSSRILGDVEAFEASDILSYNVVQDHEGIPIKVQYGTVPCSKEILASMSISSVRPLISPLQASTPVENPLALQIPSSTMNAAGGKIILKCFKRIYRFESASSYARNEQVEKDVQWTVKGLSETQAVCARPSR